jgi:murein DD-endopeptidase MepM/ murein hydrolase activator NlpD
LKRTYPQTIQPVKAASEIDRDDSAESFKQNGIGRVRSLATIGLAISVGASGILLPRSGDSARASELAPTAESTAEVQPISANGPATSAPVDGSPAELATAPVGQQLTIPPTEEVVSEPTADNIAVAAPALPAEFNPEQKLNLTGSEPLDHPAPSDLQSTAATPLATPVPTLSSIAGPNTDGAIDSLKKQENRTTASSRAQLGFEEGANSSTYTASLQSPAPSPESAFSLPQTAIPDLSATPVIPSGSAATLNNAASPDRTFESSEPSLATPSLPSAVVVPPAGSAPAKADVLYRVRSGDTLNAIAKGQGVSAKELIAVNKLGDPNFLNVNQRLKIPQVGGSNNSMMVQAAASIRASNSTSFSSAAEVPASFNPSSPAPEIGASGVAVPAPTVPVVSPLGNLEGLKNISSPIVPKINSIPLTQVSQSISDPGKLELQGEPTFTGAVDTSALPMPATATAMPIDTGEYPQSANLTPVANNIRGFRVDPNNAVPASPLAASEPLSDATEPTGQALNPYAERLRAEIVRLRSEYRAERNSIGANSVALGTDDEPLTQVATGNPSESENLNNPYLYTPEYAQPVQNEISRPPSRPWREQVQKQQQERFDPARAAQLQPIDLTPASATTSTLEQPVVATAPLGSEGYDPLSNPSLGQMVSPELPPLSDADTYLPNGGKEQQSAKGFIWPAKGVFTSGYGWRWGRMHKGIDIAGPIGTPIVAAADGVVTYAQWNDGGYGYLVEITHPDGTETVYAHNSRILVQKGQRVAQGEQVSEMGSTGFSTGPHLHFEIHPAGQGAINPMAVLPDDASRASR